MARLRTFAVWSLVLAGALFGWTVGPLAHRRRARGRDRASAGASPRRCIRRARCLTSGFLRTPGYNWVNLVGLLLAATGAVIGGDACRPTRSSWRSRPTHCRRRGAGVRRVVHRAGQTVDRPAVPARRRGVRRAAPPPAHMGVRRAHRWRGGSAARRWASSSRWWPTNFLAVLWQLGQFPPLDRNQTIPGAFRDVLRTPKVAWQDLALLRPATIVLDGRRRGGGRRSRTGAASWARPAAGTAHAVGHRRRRHRGAVAAARREPNPSGAVRLVRHHQRRACCCSSVRCCTCSPTGGPRPAASPRRVPRRRRAVHRGGVHLRVRLGAEHLPPGRAGRRADVGAPPPPWCAVGRRATLRSGRRRS